VSRAATQPGVTATKTETILRYGRLGRWFHAAVYLTVLILLATGWWFVLAGYEHRSPLAWLTGVPDGALHEDVGYVLTGVVLLWLPFGLRGIGPFVRETLRVRRGDGRWLANWPRAVFTGDFGTHDGHFDPGQRLMNVVVVLTLLALVLSGLGLLLLPAGPVDLLVVHRWAAFLLTPVLAGHVLVASGVLPGYRGVWRSIHLGGRLPVEVSRRIWPVWTERATTPRRTGTPD
jgi:cytochrome b subunit of formate dehydrogenase